MLCTALIVITLFQFTPLREGRPETNCLQKQAANFNSRPSARGDFAAPSLGMKEIFQFTPLREGRPAYFCKQYSTKAYFNSRPSARGDFCQDLFNYSEILFQFTPLREGRPVPAPC